MSVARKQPLYRAERTEAGGWRITLPLEAVPSANATTREHWAVRKRRVDELAGHLLWARLFHRVPALHVRPHIVRTGDSLGRYNERFVFEYSRATLTLYFRDIRRRDPQNYLGGAKPLFDALQRAGWLADDDAEHLTCAEPVLLVDRERPRVEVTLEPWDGKR